MTCTSASGWFYRPHLKDAERLCFYRCLSVHRVGGPLLTDPGSLVPGSFLRATPVRSFLRRRGGRRVPTSGPSTGVLPPLPPSQILAQAYPLPPDKTRTWYSSPPRQDQDSATPPPPHGPAQGTTSPPPGQDTPWTGYCAGGTPLAVTQ